MKSTGKPIYKRPLFWIGLVILVAVVAGGYLYLNQPAARAQETATVTRGDLRATVNANARVRPVTSVRLAFQASGEVKAIHVQEGDTVEKGQVLAELDARETERRLKLAQMTLDARVQELAFAQQPPSPQDLEIAQQSLNKAAFGLEAAQNRYDDDPTDENRITRELAQADYEIARANFERTTRGPTQQQLDQLNRAIETAQLDLEAAERALSETQLKAPFAGTVTEVAAQEGQLLGGFNPVVSVADLSELELLADIDEIDVAEVEPGQSVELRFDAFPGKTAQGTLTRLYPAASNDRGATVYQAIIALEPTELKLRPGMGATVNIATIEKNDVLRLPSRAVKSAGSQHVVVVRDGAGTRNIVVETGLADGSNTEIVSGIGEGTVVVIE